MTPEEDRKRRRDARCRHFNGIQNGVCESKIEYPSNHRTCFGEGDTECCGYVPFSPEELAAKEAALVRQMELMRKGLSCCCEAPFDTSQVTTSGQFKNHGPRFCSKCKKLLFWV